MDKSEWHVFDDCDFPKNTEIVHDDRTLKTLMKPDPNNSMIRHASIELKWRVGEQPPINSLNFMPYFFEENGKLLTAKESQIDLSPMHEDTDSKVLNSNDDVNPP